MPFLFAYTIVRKIEGKKNPRRSLASKKEEKIKKAKKKFWFNWDYLAGHSGSRWHRPVILPLPRAGSNHCSVKPALRSALHSRNHEAQSLRPSHMAQLFAWNGHARIKQH
ncbi:hypothetical protein PRUPE_6G169800 [Prunus persica]|uniref:Uncharacterized protein n=1 Tax=Prunus persica TaxID=3760 RepID=A0A251NTD9_PRUPE|nr:hypothetical protein PRUPE_6G169800 [Prunus persica]